MTKTNITFSQFMGDLVAARFKEDKPLGWLLHDRLIQEGRGLLAGALITFRNDPVMTNDIDREVLDFLDRNW